MGKIVNRFLMAGWLLSLTLAIAFDSSRAYDKQKVQQERTPVTSTVPSKSNILTFRFRSIRHSFNGNPMFPYSDYINVEFDVWNPGKSAVVVTPRYFKMVDEAGYELELGSHALIFCKPKARTAVTLEFLQSCNVPQRTRKLRTTLDPKFEFPIDILDVTFSETPKSSPIILKVSEETIRQHNR